MNQAARRALATGLTLALAVAVTPAARAKSDISVEVAPGVAIPVGGFLHTKAGGIDYRITNTTGFGMGVHLVLDGWEVRYALSILPTKSVEVDVDSGAISALSDISERLGTGPITGNQPDGSLSTSSGGEAIRVHHINFGYRIPLWTGPLSVYLPIGLGAAITTSSDNLLTRDLWGFSGNTGLGIDYALFDWLQIGGSVRYLITVSEVYDEASVAIEISRFGVTRDLIENSYAIGHMIHATVGATIRF